jgi:uncharacterized protein
MIAILSPSKDMSVTIGKTVLSENYSLPQFPDKAVKVMNNLKNLSPDKIVELMVVNEKLALLNYSRFQQWTIESTPQNSKCSIFTYTGEAYRGVMSSDFTSDDLSWSQYVLRILSGLYGILRPLDLIQPYRLEVGQNIPLKGISNLYNYWKPLVTNSLNKAIEESPGEKLLINLASAEYVSMIDFSKLKYPVITPSFKEEKSGQLKIVTVYTKRARGLMARFIIKNRIEKSEELKAFSEGGYYYENHLSKGNNWLFIR